MGLCQVIGDPWDLEGDGLLVFTNDNFKIHNTKFRKKLRAQAGEDYKKEVQELRRQSPIAAYHKGEDLKDYREKMWVALEEGLNATINHGLRRESAEEVAVATAHHIVKNLLTDASLTEIVIVTSLSQHESWRKRELASQKESPETWGPVQANDGRRGYTPEAGQRDYHISAVWANRLEDKVELKIKATVGEWANILMMPSYHTLATYQPLTSKFRTAYVGVVHDVMLRRLKKAGYKYAQEIERQVNELSAEEEGEEPSQPPTPRSTSEPIRKMPDQPMASSPETDIFHEYKKIKTLVREKRPEESNEDYIKDVWLMITNDTESDEARKVWLSHATALPLDKQGTAQSHYKRLVLEDMDDEDSQIRRARLRMDGGANIPWGRVDDTLKITAGVAGGRGRVMLVKQSEKEADHEGGDGNMKFRRHLPKMKIVPRSTTSCKDCGESMKKALEISYKTWKKQEDNFRHFR
ncbi:hypothetical protein CRENBAI_017459 [Crenichthys baileyi]|uniref:Uncharacterized protein n=1 Tax=Crenichthys baileyi TaxID=28760 RepID=A0AAV9QQX4_9TELE